MQMRAFFSHVAPSGGDENLRPGFDNGQLPVGQTGSAASGLPFRASEASQSPPHRHIRREARIQMRAFFSHVAPSGGDENLRPGFDNGQLPVGQTGSAASGLPFRASEASQSPPHRHISDESLYASTGFFYPASPSHPFSAA